jgi:streptogramin lyase
MSRAGLFAACAVAAVIGVTGSTPATAGPSIGLISEFPIPTASSNPSWITGGLSVSANGDLWFTQQPNTPAHGNTGAVAKITTSGVITEYTTGITPGSGPSSIAADGSGNMWFTETDGNQISKITAAGVVTEYPVPVAGSRPAGIALGADGNMWFGGGNSGPGGTQVMGRMTPTGAVKLFGAGASSNPFGVALGSDGHIWFTNYQGNNTIGRMYTSARQLPVNCGSLPTKIAARGETVLLPGDCLTNTGNRLRISVTAANPARGASQDFRLRRGPGGKISIRTFGTSPLKLSITARADRMGVYPAYSFTRTVSVGRS